MSVKDSIAIGADADAIIFVTPPEADSLIRQAAAAGCVVREEVERERLATTGPLRFRKGRFQIDLITASLPFEEISDGRASRHQLFGIRLSFPSPEDLILLKVLASLAQSAENDERTLSDHERSLSTRLAAW